MDLAKRALCNDRSALSSLSFPPVGAMLGLDLSLARVDCDASSCLLCSDAPTSNRESFVFVLVVLLSVILSVCLFWNFCGFSKGSAAYSQALLRTFPGAKEWPNLRYRQVSKSLLTRVDPSVAKQPCPDVSKSPIWESSIDSADFVISIFATLPETHLAKLGEYRAAPFHHLRRARKSARRGNDQQKNYQHEQQRFTIRREGIRAEQAGGCAAVVSGK